ncbi:MAG: UDP-N-acetylmuramoyl-tripeptide--D-alanyl-D-alanine ligase [Flavobacteriales bacterium]
MNFIRGFFMFVCMEIQDLYYLFLEKENVSTDTRNIIKDSIFFALKGENFDANQFAQQALDNGASYAIVDDKNVVKSDKFILVDDVLTTLQSLANHHRKQFKIPVIGITGSNGKTTTKELIFAVLSKKYNTLATKGNLNNHIGVPLTLLSLKTDTEIAIIEMGANHIGEIDFLSKIAEPIFGIITNIGKAHIEGFGSYEGVIQTKSELYKFIKQNEGILFVNEDDELLMDLSSEINRISYGENAKSHDFKLVESSPNLKIAWNNNIITTNLYGKYNFPNIMAAICIGDYFNVDEQDIIDAITNYVSTNNRSQFAEIRGNTYYLDAYNANPTSMNAAIETFIEGYFSNKLMILGDMLELGNVSDEEHLVIIEKAANNHLNTIFVGNNFFSFSDKYKNNKLLHFFKSYEEVIKWFVENNPKNKNILVKGSRGIKLEKIVEAQK